MIKDKSKFFKYIIKCVLEVIYYKEEYCIICNNYLLREEMICKQCKNKVKFCADYKNINFDGLKVKCYSAAYYSNIIKELIIRLKYKNDFNAGRILSVFMEEVIENERIECDIITFVPMNKKDLKLRGYNQSEFLAKDISQKIYGDIKVVKLIEKVRSSKDQIGLNKDERWVNIKGCFRFNGNKEKIKDKKILLVDDVITTGATAYYCAKQLVSAGARGVTILTAAKSKL